MPDDIGAGAPVATTPSAPAAPSSPVSPATPAQSAPSGPGDHSTPSGADAPADESHRDPKSGKFTRRPALPGVHTNREIKPIKSRAERRAELQARQTPTATPAPGDAATPPPGTPAAPTDPNAAPAPKYKFGGKDWDSQAQAEQSFSTLQGLHRSLNQRLADVTQKNQANQYSASEWKRVADDYKAQLDALQGGKPPAQGKPPAAAPGAVAGKPLDRIPESADDILADVDLGLVAEIAEERGPLAATHLLMTEALNRLLPAFRAEIERAQAPFAQFAEQSQVVSQAQALIEDVGSWQKTLPDGTATGEHLYPELSDPVALHKIAALWERLGMSPEVMLSPQGLMTAILHYRNMRSLYGGDVATGAPAAAPGTPPTMPQSSGAAAAAAAVTARLTGSTGGDTLSGPNGVAVRPAGGVESDADRIRREVREAPGIDRSLGFVPKRGARFVTA